MSVELRIGVLCLVVGLVGTHTGGIAHAGPIAGEIVQALDFKASKLVLHPTRPLLYATGYARGIVAVINTRSLSIIDEIPVGPGPSALDISPDGSRLYVADFSGVSMVDTRSREVTNFPVGFRPLSIALGFDDRLWLVREWPKTIEQFDALTGIASGPTTNGEYRGQLATSPDRKTLYHSDSGASPASLLEYDITGPSASKVWENERGMLGSGGRDLVVSHDGSFLVLTTGSGNRVAHGYDIGLIDTVNKQYIGAFNVGPYPHQITFSPDDRYAYLSHKEREIDVFDVESFEHLHTWRFERPYSASAGDMITDHTGRHLFVALTSNLLVISTGHNIIPEPACLAQAILASALAIPRIWRRKTLKHWS